MRIPDRSGYHHPRICRRRHPTCVYPGQVIWEGTNLSEGGGTTQPFELFGAPFLEPERILSYLTDKDLDGIALREAVFAPTSGKWQGKRCRGFQIHVTDTDHYLPYLTYAIMPMIFHGKILHMNMNLKGCPLT